MRIQMMTTRLLVDGFPPSYEAEDVARLFTAYSTVRSVLIVRSPTGASLGFGYVTLGSEAEVSAAIAALNGKRLHGRPLFLIRAEPPVSSTASRHRCKVRRLIAQRDLPLGAPSSLSCLLYANDTGGQSKSRQRHASSWAPNSVRACRCRVSIASVSAGSIPYGRRGGWSPNCLPC